MKLKPVAALLAATLGVSACQPTTEGEQADAASTEQSQAGDLALTTDAEKFSYALGLNLGTRLKADNMEVNTTNFAAGVAHGMEEGTALMTPQQVNETLMAASARQQATAEAEQAAAGEKNLSEGQAYLAENAKKEGVVTTDSGLQYRVVVAGDGAKPAAEDTVSVHYRGTLIDGSEFDSSHSRGEPAEFPVNRVIPGWTEALQLMPMGSTWELTIPSDLAYGAAGTGPQIGPNSTLLFEVQLLEIK